MKRVVRKSLYLVLFLLILVFVSCTSEISNGISNRSPEQPNNPKPESNSEIRVTADEANKIKLSWECSDPDGDTLTYDVYFGTNENPSLVKEAHTSKNYEVNIESGKTYYWKIVAKDGKGGVTEGPVWKFVVWIIGTLKWEPIQLGNIMHSSSAIDSDGTLYICSNEIDYSVQKVNGYVYAINPNGTKKWTNAVQINGFIFSSPVIGPDNTVYVVSNVLGKVADENGYLYAIGVDGKQKWTTPIQIKGVSSPAIGSDGTIYVTSSDGNVHAIRPDGTQKWVKSLQFIGNPYCSPAIGSDGTVYVVGYDQTNNTGYIYAIKPDGTQKWVRSFQFIGNPYCSPAIGSDGTVYVCSTSFDNTTGLFAGYLYAIKPDGTLKWTNPVQLTGGIFSSPAIGSDGTLYVVGTVVNIIEPYEAIESYIYALSSVDGKERWKYRILNSTTYFPVGIHSSPTIDTDGTIYVGSLDGKFYAFVSDSMGLSNSPWPKFRGDVRNTGRVNK